MFGKKKKYDSEMEEWAARQNSNARFIKGCVWFFCGLAILLVLGIFLIYVTSDHTKPEPTAVSAPLGSIAEPTATQMVKKVMPPTAAPTDIPPTAAVIRKVIGAGEVHSPTAEPPEAYPEPTIDPTLLIRYAKEYVSNGQILEECLIKGNINSKGDKIYHIPGTGSYDVTKINEAAGERWFCTEFDAISAGWHAPGQ